MWGSAQTCLRQILPKESKDFVDQVKAYTLRYSQPHITRQVTRTRDFFEYNKEVQYRIPEAYRPHPSSFNQEHQLLVGQEVKKLQDKGAVV